MNYPSLTHPIEPCTINVVCGTRCTGKTTLISSHVNNIIKHRQIRKVYIYNFGDSPIQYLTDLMFNALELLDNIDKDILKSISKEQLDNEHQESILILDNLMSIKTILYDDLVFNSRVMRLTIFVSTQLNWNILLPNYTANYDYVFFGRELMTSNLRRIFDRFFIEKYRYLNSNAPAGSTNTINIPSFDEFIDIYVANTKNHHFFGLHMQKYQFYCQSSKYDLMLSTIETEPIEDTFDDLLDNDSITPVLPKLMTNDHNKLVIEI